MIPSKISATTTPLPIPAFVAVLRPFNATVVVGMELAIGEVDEAVPLFLAVDGVVVVVDIPVFDAVDKDKVDVDPTVAANTNRLEVMLQQLFSPQHQLLSPHFCTGALSSCHYTFSVSEVCFSAQIHAKVLTLSKLQTSFKQFSLCQVGSVQPCLHHNFSPAFVPSYGAKF
jgi:hypothetical protein